MDIKDFKTRTSVRDYKKELMSKEDIETLIEVINNSPTSTNAQQFSTILITDQEGKDFISKHNWNQKHIAQAAGILVFIGDRTRNNHFLDSDIEDKDIKLQNYQRATVDATIASAYAQDALMAMGYGSAYIGGLPGFGKELEKFLNLPKDSFVVVGLSFGKVNSTNDFKIKLNKVYKEKYNKEQAIKEVEEYDNDLKAYYEARGLKRDFAGQNIHETNPKGGLGQGFVLSGKYHKEVIEKFKK